MAPKVGTKEVIVISVFNLILHLSMLIVGVLYNGEEHCKLEVSEYSVFHNSIAPLIFLEIMVIMKIESHPCYPIICD